jgi:hypothetical protein
LDRWNTDSNPIDTSNSLETARLGAAHRTAWETFLITVAVDQMRPQKGEDLFTSGKLSLMMGGGDVHDGRDTSARDAQFELYVGAQFRLGSVEIHGGEPDLRMRYGHELIGIAAKRVSSPASKQLKTHLNKAVEQIDRSGFRGFIAVNLDSRFDNVDLHQPVEDQLRQFEGAFDSVNSHLAKHYHKKSVLGLLLFGYVTAWGPSPISGTAPRLNTAAPLRWVRWTDDAGEALHHNDFAEAWQSRMRRRLAVLSSPDFDGQL